MLGGLGHNFRSPKVDIHQYSMIPRPDIPRSTMRITAQHKTTINASTLTPIFVWEVLPGDTFNLNMTAFCRMATPLFPILDNADLESWFFFVPNRILWSHWVNFMGEQPASPADSISYTIPTVTSPSGGFPAEGLADYMGIPSAGQIAAGQTNTVNALPFRAYNMIWNQWFRDENLDTAAVFGATGTVYDLGDGPDPSTNYALQYVRKRHDYFTSCLPWTQKGGVAVTLPLGTSATVKTSASTLFTGAQSALDFTNVSGAAITVGGTMGSSATGQLGIFNGSPGSLLENVYPNNLYADLSTATAATINSIRLAFQTQRLLERDARGGTRYQELIMSHFGVHPLDSRLQRPEYLGGGKSPVSISPVPQTAITSGTNYLGSLAAVGTAVAHRHGFRQSFTEHGYVLGLVTVRSDKGYQQGTHRMWTRSTRYDFYFPVFAMLGEQGVRNDEIYTVGTAVAGQDASIFGYQERWGEYRYMPSRTSGYFRSTNATPLDTWHLATKFGALPVLNSLFIEDDTFANFNRVLAAGGSSAYQQFLCDFLFDLKAARPMPMYSVPGLIDHF